MLLGNLEMGAKTLKINFIPSLGVVSFRREEMWGREGFNRAVSLQILKVKVGRSTSAMAAFHLGETVSGLSFMLTVSRGH